MEAKRQHTYTRTHQSCTHHFQGVVGKHCNGAGPCVLDLKGVGARIDQVCERDLECAVPQQLLCVFMCVFVGVRVCFPSRPFVLSRAQTKGKPDGHKQANGW